MESFTTNLKTLAESLCLLFNKPAKALRNGLTAIGTVYSAYVIFNAICPNRENLPFNFLRNFRFDWCVALSVFLFVSVFSFLFYILRPYFHTVKFDSGSTLRVSFMEDIISCPKDGAILVGINDELKCDIKNVAETSLHHAIIERANWEKANHNGSTSGKDAPTWIEKAFDEARKQPKLKNQNRYPPGMTFSARDPFDNRQYVFFVMSEMTGEKSATAYGPKKLNRALYKLFGETGSLPKLDENRLYAPLVGTGSGGRLCDKQDAALEMAIAFAHARQNTHTRVNHLTIVFHEKKRWKDKMLFKINMDKLNADIDACAKHCPICSQ